MILFRLVGLLFDLLLLPLRLLRRGRVAPKGAWLTVTIDGPVADIAPPRRFFQLRPDKTVALHELDRTATALLADPRILGMVVTIRSMRTGMAGARSLRAILGRIRAGGKQVAVHLPMGGETKEVYVASAASTVLVGPSAEIAPLGFRTASRYLKTALDRAGVEPQVFACGEFKSAGETLVRDQMSAPQRAQLERLLDHFHQTVLEGLREGRGLSAERAAAAIDGGPWHGRAALEAGLADDVAYEDEVQGKLGIQASHLVDAAAYLQRSTRPLFRKLRRGPAIAVVRVHGAIAHSSGPLTGLSSDERLTRTLRTVRRTPRIKGVILHIDSPGGSALASDLMHHEIVQLAADKPVIACMANIAASGGYYVAAPAKKIVAQPTTVTGSIGVVAARLSLEPLLGRIGITNEVVARGARAALLSGVGPLGDDERAALQRTLDATYEDFLAVVAEGRKRPRDEIDKLARGRVYTGTDAHAAGLVDVLGGFDVAVAELRALLPDEDRGRAEVVVLPTPRRHVPPPEDEEDKEKPAAALLGLLGVVLPDYERRLLALVLAGERVALLGPVTET